MGKKKMSDFVYPELRTTQKLTIGGDNFLSWKVKLSFVLTDHGFPHLLNPSPEDPTWNEPNDAAKYLILRTLDKFLAHEHSKHSTPASIMGSLLSKFEKLFKSYPSVGLRRYMDHRMPAGWHINQHIFRMRAMAKQLEYDFGVKIPEQVQGAFLLNSLTEDWEVDVERLLTELDGGREEDLGFFSVSRRLRALRDVRKWKEFTNGEKMKRKNSNGTCRKRGRLSSDSADQGSSDQEPSFGFRVEADTASELLYVAEYRLDCKGSLFPLWKSDISLLLQCNEIEYVLKESKPSEPTDSVSQEETDRYKKWHKDDFTARHLILGAMEDDIFLSFHDYPTAKALMDAVEAFFDYTSAARKLVRLKKYVSNYMAEDTPIETHITKTSVMVQRLEAAGMDIPSEMQSVVLVDNLPRSWNKTRQMLDLSIILDKENGWSIDNVTKKVRDVGLLKEMTALWETRSLPN